MIVKYIGRIYDGGPQGMPVIKDWDRKIFAVDENDVERELDLRLDLMNHSPTGFCWGYGGSGPAQAALAICADYFGDDQVAICRYQAFKFGVIARLSMDKDFEIDVETVRLAALPLTLADK